MLTKNYIRADYECHLLLKEIETTKERMIITALEKGFTNSKTVEISQGLDQLLNKLQPIDLRLKCIAKNA